MTKKLAHGYSSDRQLRSSRYKRMMRSVILLLIAVSAAVKGDNNCVLLNVGPDANVCICNSTYCDSVEDIQMEENQYVWYTSTKSGQRLQRSVANFSSEPMSISDDFVFTVDRNETFQTIFGFGGAMTDAAAINIRSLSNATQKNLIKSYYGANGSKYTFCRIPIAGTDFSTRSYTYDDTPNDFTLKDFSLVEEDDYKIQFLHQMKEVTPDPNSLKIFTTSWSAPAWMKYTNNIKQGSLKIEYYQLYADYIRKFFDAYKERGVDIWGITPGNEPLDGIIPYFPFNAMFWTPAAEATFSVNNLAPTLSNAGYTDLVYMAMDDQRFEIPWYTQWMFNNKKAKNLFSGTAYHWYANQYFSPMRLNQLHNIYPDKFILMTEACSGSNVLKDKNKVDLGSWQRGEDYMSDIIENLSHWVVGWVDWNLALNKNGGPNWAKNFVDSPIIVMPENDEFYKQPMYYALYHVSKFVPPNSIRISSINYNSPCEDCKVKSIAFLTPDEDVVVILLNKGDEPYNVTIQDKIKASNLIHLQLPEKSFTTLKYQASQ